MNNGLYNGLENGLHNGIYEGVYDGIRNGLYANETVLNKKIIQNGLMLHYDVSNKRCYNGGTSIYDLSVNAKNGTLFNGVGYRTTSGGTLYFDGSNDYASSTVPTLTTFSVSLWVYSFNVTGIIFYILGTNPSSSGIYFGGSAVSGLFGYYDGPSGMNISGNTAVINTWNYLTLTTSRLLNGNYEHKFYSRGTLLNNVNWSSTVITLNALNLGRRPDGNWYSNCLISHVTLYNRALSAEELKYNYETTKRIMNL